MAAAPTAPATDRPQRLSAFPEGAPLPGDMITEQQSLELELLFDVLRAIGWTGALPLDRAVQTVANR